VEIMSNDLLPMLDILAAPPQDAGREDSAGAAANTSGGSLLMTHDVGLGSPPQINGAAATVHDRDAVMDHASPAPLPTALADGLSGVAMTIRQIEAVLKANGALAPDVHFAIERIQDVAMALRMREVDAALCDTLEASIREVGDAIVRNDAAAARTLGAAALLRDLGKRIEQMMPSVRIVAAESDKADETDEADQTDIMARSGDHATKPNGAAVRQVAADAGIAMPDGDHGPSVPQPAFVHPALPEMLLSAGAGQEPARSAQPVVLSMPSPVDEAEDAAANNPPVDDPGNKQEAETANEPIPVETTAVAAPHDELAAAPATTSAPSSAESNPAPPSWQASASDPLAALHGLSDEELIALFS
jgi:hypothetical protein